MTSERAAVAVPGSAVPALAIPRLKAIAAQLAKENGCADPAWISAVVTTQEQALASATPGAVTPAGGKTVVYLVTMKGHFERKRSLRRMDRQAPGDRTQPPPLHYQSVVVSAETWRWRRTFDVIAGGLSREPPAVEPSSLGPVTWLKRQALR